jgi:hypothetical protein
MISKGYLVRIKPGRLHEKYAADEVFVVISDLWREPVGGHGIIGTLDQRGQIATLFLEDLIVVSEG